MPSSPTAGQDPQYEQVESYLRRQLSQRIVQFNQQAKLLESNRGDVQQLKKLVKVLGRCQAAGDELLKLSTGSLARGRFENLILLASGIPVQPIRSLREKKPRKKPKTKPTVVAPKHLGYARSTRRPPPGKGHVHMGIGQTRKT